MNFKNVLIRWVLCISIIAIPIKAEPFDFTQNEAVLRSFLSLNGLKMTSDKHGGAVQVEIGGMMENTPFKINGHFGPLIQAVDPKLGWPVHITLEAAGAKLTIGGTINDLNKFEGVDLEFMLSGQNLGGFENMFAKNLPKLEPFVFRGNLKDTQPLRFELSNLHLVMEKSEIKGSGIMDFSQSQPHITVNFFSPYLDLRKVLAGNDTPAENDILVKTFEDQVTESIRNGKVFSDQPFDLKFLKSWDLKFEFLAEKMLLPRIALKNFYLQASIRDGGFAVDTVTSSIGGGRLAGNFKIEPSDEIFIVSTLLNIDQMALHRMLEDLEMDIQGEGLLDVRLDLNSKGISISEMMAGLDGTASLLMGEGRIDRNYLRFLGFYRINLISSLVNILSFPSVIGKNEETSVTNCVVMRFDVNRGIANLTAFILDTPKTTIAANGRINLSNEKVDIYVKPISKEGIGAEGLAKFNLSLSELTRVLYLGGTLANPNVAVDSTQTFVTLGKAIGGVVLFGPAGVAAALLSGKIGGGSQNLCLEAIEAAQKGVEISEERPGIFNRLGDFLKRLNPLN
jgi:AsmA family protein